MTLFTRYHSYASNDNFSVQYFLLTKKIICVCVTNKPQKNPLLFVPHWCFYRKYEVKSVSECTEVGTLQIREKNNLFFVGKLLVYIKKINRASVHLIYPDLGAGSSPPEIDVASLYRPWK